MLVKLPAHTHTHTDPLILSHAPTLLSQCVHVSAHTLWLPGSILRSWPCLLICHSLDSLPLCLVGPNIPTHKTMNGACLTEIIPLSYQTEKILLNFPVAHQWLTSSSVPKFPFLTSQNKFLSVYLINLNEYFLSFNVVGSNSVSLLLYVMPVSSGTSLGEHFCTLSSFLTCFFRCKIHARPALSRAQNDFSEIPESYLDIPDEHWLQRLLG